MKKKLQQRQFEGCEICYPVDDETKSMIISLLNSIASSMIEEGEKIPDVGGFTQLIKIIFHTKYKNLRSTDKCKHQHLKHLILDKLKINPAKLDFISNKKACLMAKKNFHIDMISLQIKSFTRHFKMSDKLKKDEGGEKKKEKGQQTIIKEEADENVETFNRIQSLNTNNKPFPHMDYQFGQMFGKMGFFFSQGVNFPANS